MGSSVGGGRCRARGLGPEPDLHLCAPTTSTRTRTPPTSCSAPAPTPSRLSSSSRRGCGRGTAPRRHSARCWAALKPKPPATSGTLPQGGPTLAAHEPGAARHERDVVRDQAGTHEPRASENPGQGQAGHGAIAAHHLLGHEPWQHEGDSIPAWAGSVSQSKSEDGRRPVLDRPSIPYHRTSTRSASPWNWGVWLRRRCAAFLST